jgi:hypothetical protein
VIEPYVGNPNIGETPVDNPDKDEEISIEKIESIIDDFYKTANRYKEKGEEFDNARVVKYAEGLKYICDNYRNKINN